MNPVSAIFAAGVAARNKLYDRKFFQVRKLSRPVVSVGNLSVGGSGKTPFVIALGGLLKERGIPFDVLSRGYGRQSSEVLVVDPEGAPGKFGDEPLLIARKLQVPVIVGADRYQAGLLAEQKFPSKLHLLDDGFQHRRLHRDFDIVLLQAHDLDDTVLPVGRLREPLSALRRADAVVLPPNIAPPAHVRLVWRARRNVSFVTPMKRVVAFCGLARPEQFFSALKQLGMDVADTVAFPDHHRYQQRDIDRLIQRKARATARGFITTDKDAVNLGPLLLQLRTFETAGLELQLERPANVISALLAALEERCGCGFQPET
ncbi:MAG TPA: tetraacyldisaccharide 4'-kinase [Verrucomicrobiae bacterium]|jgi:tetraacyldisaccharide 4'-kinase|nr:tetraacyldisaccharide 4'-kinase [Verrucomicrobiae bacterium]